uniref:Large ribosomal subunit protein eL32 n=1 Tax=uncultured korarchaeote TaxID=161241 RepID=A0A1L2JMP1_9CREN|nr:ribosomal protein L32E [uncultured korarchaeote]
MKKKKFIRIGVKPNKMYRWRRPRGIDNKQRLKLKSRPPMPEIGYGKQKSIKGLHPSGLKPVLVYNAKMLENIDRDKVIAIVGRTVGKRKRLEIAKKAAELGVKIANLGELIDQSKLSEEASS